MTKLATICYIDNGEALLLLHRNKKPNDVHEGKWISVGGKLEAGETPDECAKREIFEETHFTVKEMGEKWGITSRMVTIYCKEERIPGAPPYILSLIYFIISKFSIFRSN